MKKFLGIVAAFCIFAVAACAPTATPPVVAVQCEGPTVADDKAELAAIAPKPLELFGKQAREFVERTAGAVEARNLPFYHKVERAVAWPSRDGSTYLVGLYDANECRIASGVFPAELVVGRGA